MSIYMSDKTLEQDKTSKPNDPLNVIPSESDGKSTSGDQATDMSGGDSDNTQAAVQKQVELRRLAEEKAEKLAEEKRELEEARQKDQLELRTEREARIKSALTSKIQNSSLTQTVKDRFLKDPVKYFIANQSESKEWTWGDVASAVDNVETLNGWLKDIEGTYGVQTNQTSPSLKDTFVDRDRPNDNTPSDGELTIDRIKKMTPYEINKLPLDVKNQLKEAGGIPE